MRAVTWQGIGQVAVEDVPDPLGAEQLTTPRVPLAQAPQVCADVQKKADGMIAVVLEP